MIPGCGSLTWHANRTRKLSTVSQYDLSIDRRMSSLLG